MAALPLRKASTTRYSVGCLVLTHDNKILLQQRDEQCARYPGCLGTFGGGIEINESPMQALVRELQEELGASVNPEEVVPLGALTENNYPPDELVYVYFWHDKQGTITGCYEGTTSSHTNCATPLLHPKVMNDVRWLLAECHRLGLV
jgi:8-oxo-dGTP diphosphatase